MPSPNQDYLTSIPPEVLNKILAELPLRSFLDLEHTSSGLRDFMRTYASD
jgi:hypothetical protein